MQPIDRRQNYRRWVTRLGIFAFATLASSYVFLSQSARNALECDDFYTATKLMKLGVLRPDSSMLLDAVRDRNLGLVQWLLDHGVSVKHMSAHETYELLETAIMWTEVWKGSSPGTYGSGMQRQDTRSIAILKTLLDKGADPNVKSGPQGPLIFEALSNPKSLELLLDHGARVDADYGTGNTPIQMAAVWGRATAIPILAEHGADLNEPNLDGVTPLTYAHHVFASATAADYKATYYALLSAGADPNAWSSDIDVSGEPQTWPGSPPLHNRMHGVGLIIAGFDSNVSINWKYPNTPIKWWSIRARYGHFQATLRNPQGVYVPAVASANMTVKLPRSAPEGLYDAVICTAHEETIGTLMLKPEAP